jgi:hypothetical protein
VWRPSNQEEDFYALQATTNRAEVHVDLSSSVYVSEICPKISSFPDALRGYA